jgi:murein L,D-transpeptidase YcbB/YkuD
VKPRDPYPNLEALARQLAALADLASDVPVPALYEGAIVDGVRRFQERHGLEPDGVLGRGTIAALNVPMAERVVQIELALERLRWMPHLSTDRFLAVNIPMFQLWGWDGVPPDGAPTFGMRVIVGRALSTETPVFVEEMRHVIFRPYWNVPPSILRGEVVPALRKDPRYLEKHDMEIVAGQSDRSPVVPATPENIARLGSGSLRVRQRPGPSNSLGLVKFVFPNDDNIYMHGTPAPQLFGRPRRDFSHGCIRVQDPVSLAEWVLAGEPEWTRERIVGAMNGTSPQQVNLARPVQVILFYITAVVMPGDGTVRFAEDIYRHDARLRKALAGRTTS